MTAIIMGMDDPGNYLARQFDNYIIVPNSDMTERKVSGFVTRERIGSGKQYRATSYHCVRDECTVQASADRGR